MKSIKLWKIIAESDSKLSVLPIMNVEQTETENQLEEIITRRPEILIEELKLVGRQTETAGGPLDLLGVDSDGRLVVFELKRGTLTRDAVAQILDYASYLAELEPEALSSHISERSGNLGIDKITDFLAWYQEHYATGFVHPQKPRMILVGLGADDRTRRMVSFLADSEIDISLITFHGFKDANQVFLARQIEVEAKAPPGTTAATKKTNLEKLQLKVGALGVGDFYYKLAEFFRDQLPAYEWPNQGGYSYSLAELTPSGNDSLRVYISLYIYDAKPGRVEIRIHPRAVEAAQASYESFKPHLKSRISTRSDGGAEVWIKTLKEWEDVSSAFVELCRAVVDGWKQKREQKSVEEFKAAEQEIEAPEAEAPAADLN